jgi:hypothetical protein
VDGSLPSRQCSSEPLSLSGLVLHERLTGLAVNTLLLARYSRNVVVNDVSASSGSGCSRLDGMSFQGDVSGDKFELDNTSTGFLLLGVIIASCQIKVSGYYLRF